MTLEPGATFEPTELPQPPELIAINNAVRELERLDDQPEQHADSTAAIVALAWSNVALAISEVNRNAAAKNVGDIAVDWLANPSEEGFALFRAAVEQYLVLR